ncbi:sugar transferase [Pisciglobus halotolerans]|uniref:Exopolysaccharide biosynthesis polyprenyl glycosylphosphotransferase n=1 Tax=Pisciglobus halotolerans TaxID=745365 RepID=A0A1I3CQC9_9LACT|nr:sugar transferase [Pisciglobus halotolerans]SFH76568.1 exopolysaccharide biosynthesis polyprenyl glycosylphosphotransferase [Pisciglobus halotolerans]
MGQGERYGKLKKVMICIFDALIYHLSIIFSFYLRYSGNIPNYNYAAYKESAIYITILFILLNVLFGVYVLYNKSVVDFLYLTVIIQLIMTVSIMAVTFFGRWFTFPRSVLLISFLLSFIFLFLWRIVVYRLYEKFNGSKKMMIIGKEEDVKNAVFNIGNAKSKRHIIEYAAIQNYYSNIKSHLNDIDIVYLASEIEEAEKLRIYDLLVAKKKKIFLNTSFENLVLVNPNIMNIEDESIIEVSNFEIPSEDGVVKRLFDILFSVLLIIVASPIMLITACLVKLTSQGPILYKQVRITKDGEEFNVLKFRSMSTTAEKETGPVLASSNDARVTTVGKYIRALRIDELPQLFNVLKGDMSIVGPRPERPFFVEQFQEENPYYYLRHNVRAGITGYAQVYGKYASDFNSKLNFDLLYIKKYTLLLDIKIMLQTIKILFDKVSSKGLDEEEMLAKKEIPVSIKVLK